MPKIFGWLFVSREPALTAFENDNKGSVRQHIGNVFALNFRGAYGFNYAGTSIFVNFYEGLA